MGAQLSFDALNELQDIDGLLETTSSHHQAELFSRIGELSIPGNSAFSRHTLPAVLTSLSTQMDPGGADRWLCWVAAVPYTTLIDKPLRKNHKVLQVVAKTDLVTLAERALASGRSHTVVLAIGRSLDYSEQIRLERAAEKGDSELMLLR